MPYEFTDLIPALQSQAGGKGAVLARLARAGYPVPAGLVILPKDFIDDHLEAEAWTHVQSWLARQRKSRPEAAFAVRSSALDEDSAQASFAGEFETVLEVCGDEAVREAIHAVRRSRHNARAAAYSAARGLRQDHEMAVVVQNLVKAEFSGVLFTADPLTGDLLHMPGNFVRGLGEGLVGGQAGAETFSLDRRRGRYTGPAELKRYAHRLYRLAVRVDALSGVSQDIEWAIAGNKVHLLQARPITSMREFDPVTGLLNSSLTGDFLWSNGNAAEIQPEVMTLLTWSVGKLWGKGYNRWWSRYPASGNIGGRNYFNISVQVSPFAAIPGVRLQSLMRYVGDWWGRVPANVTVPLVPFSALEILRSIVMFLASAPRFARLRPQIPGFVQGTPAWCRSQRERLRAIQDRITLTTLWREELEPYYCFGTAMASAANSGNQLALQGELRKLAGEDDADALLSNLGGREYLASLGPLVNLARVARGEITREEYLEGYGHRGPHEFELARPQPVDDPAWLENQLTDFARHPFDPEARLEKQRRRFDSAWKRLCARHPRKAGKIKQRLDEAARLARQREQARSELTRVMGVLRAFSLRAGEFIGIGDNVFHLTIDEVLAALDGDESACRFLPARLEVHARYRALPPYPPVISGRFDPFGWAADPNRRLDLFDSHAPTPAPASDVITGFPGAAGVVEGRVRRIDCMEDGHLLEPGEILVTVTTNVGWTPLFPRAAAVVTDVGAPLSHAAIVARELGVPAVVGCNDATMRLHNGDCVRVNGARGTVEILQTVTIEA
jgi:phosphohistidine swiveling domain-containing protein